MAKDYWFTPTSQDPRTMTGLAPTFIIFMSVGGTAMTAPAINEPGVSTGLYHFSYGATQSIVFTIDSGSSVSSTDRYISSVLDPIQTVDQQIGFSTDSIGTTTVDPSTIWGMEKRNQEFNEGNSSYNKSTSIWTVSSRGSSINIMTKTLSNTTSTATKT